MASSLFCTTASIFALNAKDFPAFKCPNSRNPDRAFSPRSCVPS